jgi:hypothetical protein
MKTLTIKGQNIKADVIIGTTQVIVSQNVQDNQNSKTVLEAIAIVNGFEVKGTQTTRNGNCSVQYQFEGITFADSHKKIAEYLYIKHGLANN